MLSARQRLIEDGAFVIVDGTLVLTRNHVFTSPSLAAAMLLGRNAIGRIEWKDGAGTTLKALQEAAQSTTNARDLTDNLDGL